jgi:hypothetical protein
MSPLNTARLRVLSSRRLHSRATIPFPGPGIKRTTSDLLPNSKVSLVIVIVGHVNVYNIMIVSCTSHEFLTPEVDDVAECSQRERSRNV